MLRPLPRLRWVAFLVLAGGYSLMWLLQWTVWAERPDPALGIGGFLIASVGLIPVACYVAQRPCRPRLLWKAYFYFALIFAALGVLGAVGKVASLAPLEIAELVFGFALVCLYLVAVENYLNRSPHIWAT